MERKKIGLAAFVCAAAALCLVPAAATLWQHDGAVGNEQLASAPELTEESGAFNADVLDEFTDYFAGHFGYRHQMITLNGSLTAGTLRTLDSSSVLLGKDGWLFYRNTEEDYTGANLFSTRQAYAAAHTLALMQEWCEENGIDFCFTVAPNKNSLYGQYMPQRYKAASTRNIDLLVQQLEQQSVHYADLFGLLENQSEQLYYKYDSHWNMAGAQLAANYLLSELGEEEQDFDAYKTGESEAHTGDLYEMVYPSGTKTEQDAAYAFEYEYLGNFRSAEDITIRTQNQSAQGSIFVYRDSFGINLHPFLAQSYGSACFSRSMPYRMTAVLDEAPDTLLVEIVERNLDWLLERAPELPAPERTLAETPAASAGTAAAACEESRMEGYVCLSGDLASFAVDIASPIYIMVGDTVYESSPSGEGEQPFTAYLPAGAAGQELTAVFYAGGQLVSCTLEY